MLSEDPMFLRRVFVSHYLSVPYHQMLDETTYPKTLIEELYAASYFLIRNFELSPYREGKMEDKLIDDIEHGRI